MNIYWTLKSIPEMELLTRDERRKAWSFSSIRTYKHWETWVGLVILMLITGLGSSCLGTLGAVIGGGLGGFIYGNIISHKSRKYISEWKVDNRHLLK